MAAAALAIGTGIQMYGSYKSGMDKQAAYEAEAANKVAQAAQVEIAANREIELTGERFRRYAGAQKMAFSRSGVQLGTGSPLEVLEQTAADAMGEIISIRNAANYRKTSLLTEGIYAREFGQQAADAGILGAIGAGFSGIGKNPYLFDSPRVTTPSVGSSVGGSTGRSLGGSIK